MSNLPLEDERRAYEFAVAVAPSVVARYYQDSILAHEDAANEIWDLAEAIIREMHERYDKKPKPGETEK